MNFNIYLGQVGGFSRPLKVKTKIVKRIIKYIFFMSNEILEELKQIRRVSQRE